MCAFWDYLVKNPIIITGVIAITGWAVIHCFSKHRDRKNKQREIRIQYLINAWRNVVRADTIRDYQSFSEALLDIQLLGTLRQIKLTKQVVDDIFKKDDWNAKELSNDLRTSLRRELSLPKTNEKVLYLHEKKAASKNLIPKVNEKGNVGNFQKLIEILKEEMNK